MGARGVEEGGKGFEEYREGEMGERCEEYCWSWRGYGMGSGGMELDEWNIWRRSQEDVEPDR